MLIPQSAGDWADVNHDPLSESLTLAVGIMDVLAGEFSIDPQRLYVAGNPMAGMESGNSSPRDLSSSPRRSPSVVAEIRPCPTRHAVPVWAFHGTADTNIPVAASRQMVAAIKKAGGHPRYTEYPGAGHDIWTRVFAEPESIWVFAQHN